jgi:PIN domain nuclease of toxin-antitoxin system
MLNQEAGSDVVAGILQDSVISAVNLSEVAAKLSAAGMPAEAVYGILRPLGLVVIPFGEEQAYEAGLLRAATRDAGISMGDRACLSLAKMLKVTAITADRAWTHLDIGVDVRVIR